MENPHRASAVIPTLTAVTLPVPNFLVRRSLCRLEMMVPNAMFLYSCFLCNDIIYHNPKISCWIDISYTIMKLYWYTQIYCWNAESCNSTKRYDCEERNLSGSRCWRVLDYPTFSWQTKLSVILYEHINENDFCRNKKKSEAGEQFEYNLYMYIDCSLFSFLNINAVELCISIVRCWGIINSLLYKNYNRK